jgi:hypothetical protein
MVPVERPMTNEKFASREKIRKWKTGIKAVFWAEFFARSGISLCL